LPLPPNSSAPGDGGGGGGGEAGFGSAAYNALTWFKPRVVAYLLNKGYVVHMSGKLPGQCACRSAVFRGALPSGSSLFFEAHYPVAAACFSRRITQWQPAALGMVVPPLHVSR
jgi:hypothetical protein